MNFRDPFASTATPQGRSGTLFVAPEGDILVPGTPAFYERIGYRNPDFDLGDYAVRNMGFVSIGRVAPTRLRIRFRAALVTGRALETICHYFARGSSDEIEIEYFAGAEWQTEIWPNDPAVLNRLAELCTKPEDQRPSAPFDIKALEIGNASSDYSNPLKPLFQKWRSAFGTFDDSTLPFLQRFGFLRRLVIITSPDPNASPQFQFIGSHVRIYDEPTMLELIGRPVDQQPNKDYGEWISAHYRGMIDAASPRLDLLQIAIPEDNDVRRVSYERLLLPWRSPAGMPLITCMSVVTSDERQAPANENGAETDPGVLSSFGRSRAGEEPLQFR